MSALSGISTGNSDFQPTVHTNNCWGNMDYSPLAPTDTLNVKISPALTGVLTGGVISAATQGPTVALKGLGLAIPSVIASDLARGDHSLTIFWVYWFYNSVLL